MSPESAPTPTPTPTEAHILNQSGVSAEYVTTNGAPPEMAYLVMPPPWAVTAAQLLVVLVIVGAVWGVHRHGVDTATAKRVVHNGAVAMGGWFGARMGTVVTTEYYYIVGLGIVGVALAYVVSHYVLLNVDGDDTDDQEAPA